ncbi:MAG: 2-C-methyl-D-erythritol 2,4-cyclodiphosphate synthase [Puniceicoccales bacterium]|jgi:2-C-methyl-D-erythritol 2,4-cyclodiphosphate synthase|nr:2-C-methyl-D-erythritol 2,4-cyclodiphosphate synthase [Puniceicoccales bacterium]
MLRVGIGRDVHRLAHGRRLVLGGVCVDEHRGCVAHSDGDCVAHAVMDAILGAAGMPNIGVLFPNDDEANQGRDSMEMAAHVVRLAREAGFSVENVDSVIQLERPLLGPFLAAMRDRMAGAFGVNPERVGLKATTAEGIGAVGAGDAIEVYSVCLLREVGVRG